MGRNEIRPSDAEAYRRKPILNHLKLGQEVYDPFLGSGTTLAAAESTGRVCCGIELDPKYVDVVIERWQKMSGKQATFDDGRTFAELRAQRLGVESVDLLRR